MSQTQSTKELTIDGATYMVSMLPAVQGLKVLTKITKLIGEPLSELIKAQGGGREKIFEVLPTAVKTLTQRLDEDEVIALVLELCDCVVPMGKSQSLKDIFNQHFKGKYGHLFKVLMEVVNHNFSDFLDVLPLAKAEGQAANQK